MGRKSKYSKELKIQIVKKYLNGEKSTLQLADEIGTVDSVIGRWVKKYRKYGESAFDEKKNNSPYTKDFKLKVIQAYLNGEGSQDDIANKFGISSGTTIFKWVKDYNNHIEIKDYIPGKKEIYMSKSRNVTPEERIEIVRYCIEHNCDYKSTAQIYETTYANVFNWIKKYRENGEEGLTDKRGRHKKEDELTEVERLRRELKKKEHELEMARFEVDFLKKVQEIERRWSGEKAGMNQNTKPSKK